MAIILADMYGGNMQILVIAECHETNQIDLPVVELPGSLCRMPQRATLAAYTTGTWSFGRLSTSPPWP